MNVASKFLHFLNLMISSLLLINAQPIDQFPLANLSTLWINSPIDVCNNSEISVRAIILRGTFGPRFVCGFHCNFLNDACVFAVSIFQTRTGANTPYIEDPRLVWSANRNNPVKINATLNLSQEGDLILKDVDGTYVWSTNTANKSVSGLNLTEEGNLVLFDRNNAVVWQSFDHPTDSLVPGQRLVSGQKLIASISASNWSESGLLSLTVVDSELEEKSNRLVAYVETNPPLVYQYYDFWRFYSTINNTPYMNGSFAGFNLPPATSAQFMKFGPDGHLRVNAWGGSDWKEVSDLLSSNPCAYPFVCGNYGICSAGPQCSCPGAAGRTNFFRQVNDRQPNLGCTAITPISCELSQYQGFLEVKYIYYFAFRIDINNTGMETCKQACLKNCSCEVALFRHGFPNASNGDCFLMSEIFSLMNYEATTYHFNTIAFFKVQNSTSNLHEKKSNRVAIIVGSTLGAVLGVSLLLIGICFCFLGRNKYSKINVEEHYLDQVPGMPTRYSYEDLKAVTRDFNKKLGEGGFGSVFEGTLIDGTKVAVKRLDGFEQIKKSFLAEVETIGSIHHFNLVRLIGFCAENSHRLLVYDYLCNGSLDKWIFRKTNEFMLDWHQRKKIIVDIAKGLAYLHEDCRQKIVHLDVKPGNVLLDENFNAKVSDFGLSKLIDRDQSQVVTTMRGTPGYLAPEWLSSIITEKVDVYSFGVMTLEILCGRKNFDSTQPEEEMHLLNLFQIKAEQEQLLDLVDKRIGNIELHKAEILQMMKVAAWCLQSDFARRPSMSVVVKVLEGVMDVEDNLDYNFSSRPLLNTRARVIHHEINTTASTPPLPSVLSAPR